MTVASNVQNIMKKKGWTIVQTSQKSSVPQITIKSIIYGKSINPKLETLEKLAKAFDCNINELTQKHISIKTSNNNDDFDLKLFNIASGEVEKYLTNKKINFDKNKTIKLINSVYSLMQTKNNKKIDDEMINWIINTIF